MLDTNKFKKQHVVFYKVTKDDLPFHCPPKETENWNLHPKVFLDLEKKGHATCPYCSAYYTFDTQENK
ncbi:hypothetical protein MNB_SUP05-5-326 [hydrothermal vent metagenome]|uniref:Zinc finger CHCC-type domain-containing protein n=1 Tax=hydrothermal vent metagenome TaxID=652676 RepID=A0A1W1BN10_9ZZZZ